MSLRIRNSLERADWAFVREVCARTGNAGAPIDPARWPFFGEQWVGPYERLRPEWTFVAEELDPTGARIPLGYLTGSPDTAVFLGEKLWRFDLPLFGRTVLGAYPKNVDTVGFRRRFLAEFFRRKEGLGPRDAFDPEATLGVHRDYPAHLHINLLDLARGKGVGRLLVDRFREKLAANGVHGIHLYCGEKPLPFYEKVGFRRLDQVEFRPGFMVYRLGSRF